jgi:putative transposase
MKAICASENFVLFMAYSCYQPPILNWNFPAQNGPETGKQVRRWKMPRKIYKPEEIIAKLRQVEILTSQGKTAIDAIRSIGVTDATFYRWRQEYGGLKVDQVKRMKELEAENARLRRAVSDLTVEKLILKEAASGNLWSAPWLQGFSSSLDKNGLR